MEALFGRHAGSYDGAQLEWFCRCEEARRYKVGWGLWVGYRGDRAVSFSYSLGPKNPEPETPEEMLKIVGLDVRGVPPSQSGQTPMAGASGGPFGGLIGGQSNYLLWTGEVGGVEWNYIVVGGAESRGSGSTMFRPKNWRLKRRYYHVTANAAEAL